MKQLKVGQWWNNLDTDQQEAFKVLYFTGQYDVNPIRKFLTAAKKRFAQPAYTFRKFNVEAEGSIWAYSQDTDRFIQIQQETK